MANEIKTLIDSLDKVRRDWVEDWREDVRSDWKSLAGNAGPSNSVAPTITGTATVGQTLTCNSNGTWDGSPTFRYQWQRKLPAASTWDRIGGANASTYLLKAADAGYQVRVQVHGSNVNGSASAVSTASSTVAAS